jgi:uncharacterized protein with NRDE domain
MCLIVFDWQPGQQLRLAANRDEFYQRPTAPMHVWPTEPPILAGKDLDQGGSWLGISQTGRIAMLTNVRQPGQGRDARQSRGALVTDFLLSALPADDYLQSLAPNDYGPFNLICGTLDALWYLSNCSSQPAQRIAAGAHVLSNAALDTPWPKAELARQQLADYPAELPLGILNQRQPFADEQLPNTGVPAELEKQLSAQHIHIAGSYGTRCQTAIHWRGQQLQMAERSFNSDAQPDVDCHWRWQLQENTVDG